MPVAECNADDLFILAKAAGIDVDALELKEVKARLSALERHGLLVVVVDRRQLRVKLPVDLRGRETVLLRARHV